MSEGARNGVRYLKCAFRNGPQATNGLRFCIDPPNEGHLMRDSITFRGWVVHERQEVLEVICRLSDGTRLASIRPQLFRPGVAARFQAYRTPEKAGFELSLGDPAPGEYGFFALLEDGREFSLGTVRVTAHWRPRLLFMHIAKTAGTSVNRYFARHYPQDLAATHVESDIRWNQDPEFARSLEFVSGHIRLAQFEQMLDLADYYKVTVLREPYAHLRSHIAWIKHLSEPSEAARLEKHPPYIRALSASLWDLDLSDSQRLSQFVESLSGDALQLLDNCQTRYFSQPKPTQRLAEHDFLVAKQALGRFDKVGLTESLQPFLAEVARDLQLDLPQESVRENVTKTYYQLDTERPEIREAVRPLIQFDARLYQLARERSRTTLAIS